MPVGNPAVADLTATTAWSRALLLKTNATGGLASLGLPVYNTDDYADDVDALVTAAGAGPYVVNVNSDSVVSANTTTDDDIVWTFQPGCTVTVNTGVTLTIESPEHIQAGQRHSCFALAGTGAVAFTKAGTVYPQWWGAVADGATDDAAAIQAAIDAVTAGSVVDFPAGTYGLASALAPKSFVTMRGQGLATVLYALAANADAIFQTAVQYERGVIEGFAFRSADKDVSVLENTATTTYIAYLRMRDCEVYSEFDVAIAGLFGSCLFENIRFGYLGTPGTNWQPVKLVGPSSGKNIFSNTFVHCNFYHGTSTVDGMVQLETGWAQTFIGCVFEQSNCRALYAKGVQSIELYECNFEHLLCNGHTYNAAVYLTIDSALAQGSSAVFRSCKFQNNAATVWDAVCCTYNATFVSFESCSGSLGSKYFSMWPGPLYDEANPGLFRLTNNRCVSYGGTAPSVYQQYPITVGGIKHTGETVTPMETLPVNDATPSINNGTFFTMSGGTGATVTTLDDGVDGQHVIIYVIGSQYTIDFSGGGNLKGNGGVDAVGPGRLDAIYDGTNNLWHCQWEGY